MALFAGGEGFESPEIAVFGVVVYAGVRPFRLLYRIMRSLIFVTIINSTIHPNLTDTHPEVERVLNEMLREVHAWRKLEMMGQLNATARHLAMEGLRERYPEATEAELKRRMADLLLGHELAEKAYGPIAT